MSFEFINRKSELKRLNFGLRNINNFVLIAPRRYGKTVLVRKALSEIAKLDDYIIIEIDLMRYLGSGVRSIAEGIIERSLNSLGIMGRLRLWLKQVEFSINVKLKYKDLELEPAIKLFKEANQDDYWKLLETALELPQKIALKEKKKVIVFFDEFSELAQMDDNVLKIFRSVLQLHRNVSYVFAGSQESLMNEIFIEKSAAFYRFGEIIQLQELAREDVYTYTLDNFPTIPFDVLSEFLELTKCHPYYVSKIMDQFRYDNEYYANINNFYRFINEVLISQEHTYIELQLLKVIERKHSMEVLRIIAMGLNPYEELNTVPQTTLGVLNNLEAAGYIKKLARATYVLTDPLIGYYLTNY